VQRKTHGYLPSCRGHHRSLNGTKLYCLMTEAHMCANNLPEVVTWRRNDQESNLQTFDSNTLTTTHRLTGQGKLISFFQLQNTAARETDHNVNLVNRSVTMPLTSVTMPLTIPTFWCEKATAPSWWRSNSCRSRFQRTSCVNISVTRFLVNYTYNTMQAHDSFQANQHRYKQWTKHETRSLNKLGMW